MDIDWEPLLKYPPNENSCRCGRVFESHTKLVKLGDRLACVSRLPCPGCGRSDDLWRSSAPPESYSIEGRCASPS